MIGAVVAAGALIVVYLLAVWTVAGQLLENAALRGADQVRADERTQADEALGAITIWSLGLSAILVAAIALLRRRIDLAIAGVGVIVLGQVITQSLKRFLLPRPPLVEVVGDYAGNSFPSGHTTIAMTVLFALLIVVPYRWRGLAMFLVLSWAIGIGAYTVTAKWHRFSDTLGADAVALLCACLATWWLARRGAITRVEGPPRRLRVVLVAFWGLLAAVLLAAGGVLWGIPLLRGVDLALRNSVQDFTAYLGAHALAGGASAAAALTFWGLWHRREVRTPGSAAPAPG
ncbi:phosphatase PAP2 family protein [Leucobacter chromiiresistens]